MAAGLLPLFLTVISPTWLNARTLQYILSKFTKAISTSRNEDR
jgi:hypothetical protein